MRRRYTAFSILFVTLFFSAAIYGQTTNVSKEEMGTVLKKSNDWFINTPVYSLTVTHASYETYTSELPVEKQIGYFRKNGKSYNSDLLGIKTIQNDKYKFVIDTSEKKILVAEPDQLSWISYTKEDYDFLLKHCVAIRMTKVGRYVFYRMELSENNPISVYEFLTDENGRVREINWYYNKEVSINEEDNALKVKPRLSISFSAFKEDVSFNYDDMFSETRFFTKKDNQLIATGNYRNFKLMDQRLHK